MTTVSPWTHVRSPSPRTSGNVILVATVQKVRGADIPPHGHPNFYALLQSVTLKPFTGQFEKPPVGMVPPNQPRSLKTFRLTKTKF
jgi:hypothetical protein